MCLGHYLFVDTALHWNNPSRCSRTSSGIKKLLRRYWLRGCGKTLWAPTHSHGVQTERLLLCSARRRWRGNKGAVLHRWDKRRACGKRARVCVSLCVCINAQTRKKPAIPFANIDMGVPAQSCYKDYCLLRSHFIKLKHTPPAARRCRCRRCRHFLPLAALFESDQRLLEAVWLRMAGRRRLFGRYPLAARGRKRLRCSQCLKIQRIEVRPRFMAWNMLLKRLPVLPAGWSRAANYPANCPYKRPVLELYPKCIWERNLALSPWPYSRLRIDSWYEKLIT